MIENAGMPKSSRLVEIVVAALGELGGSATSKQIDAKAIEMLKLSAEQISLKHSEGSSSRTEIQYRLAWARTLAKRKNLVRLSDQSIWSTV